MNKSNRNNLLRGHFSEKIRLNMFVVPLLLLFQLVVVSVIFLIISFKKPNWFANEVESILGPLLMIPVTLGVCFITYAVFNIISRRKVSTLKYLLIVLFTATPIQSILMINLNLSTNMTLYNYLKELHAGREVLHSQYTDFRGIEPSIQNNITKQLPSEWKLIGARFDTEHKMVWFSALEPSYFYGSVRYIGVFRGNQILDKKPIKEIWKQTLQIKKLPDSVHYTSASGYSNILFSTTTNRLYEVKLRVDKDKIEIVSVD